METKMNRNKLHSNHIAVAGVIEALLLVALVAVIISTIQLVYIPDIMKQKEADHMDEVENQFSHLKSVVDLQSQVKEQGPISSSITLGSRELPYFVTGRAFGRLSYTDDDENYIEINDNSEQINLNAIEFQSVNAYYLNQYYILEGGGVILKQDDGGEAMKIHPPITIENSSQPTHETVFLNWTIHNFTVLGGKRSAEGYKSCYIRTQFDSNDTKYYADISTIKIYSNYVNAWNQSVSWLIDQMNFHDNITVTNNDTYIEIKPNNNAILHVKLDIITINIQIGIGTIMQYSGKN
jgi:hypothetical protein